VVGLTRPHPILHHLIVKAPALSIHSVGPRPTVPTHPGSVPRDI